MLVLTRKKGERIVIAGGIEIAVVDVKGDKVRIGVTAPTNVPVHRSEVWDRIAEEAVRNQAIAGSGNLATQ